MSRRMEKTLILCVDRDNDVGTKSSVTAPIVGRDENFRAASNLALRDPEEADANAIFGAVRTYDTLASESKNGDYEIATITGSELGGVKADIRLKEQLDEVLGKYPADNAILVTDGFADETVIPIIQSRLPIISVRRVIVKHSDSIEESAALLSRYMKTLVENSYYSRWVLGVPGALIVTWGVLWFLSSISPFNFLLYTSIFFTIIIGLTFFVKGFRIDTRLRLLFYPTPPNLVRGFATLVALVIIGVDAYLTYLRMWQTLGDPMSWGNIFPRAIGQAIAYSIDLLVISVFTFLVGWGIYYYFTHDQRIWHGVVGGVISVWVREITLKASNILLLKTPTVIGPEIVTDFALTVALGFTTTVITILAVTRLSRRFAYYFQKSEADLG